MERGSSQIVYDKKRSPLAFMIKLGCDTAEALPGFPGDLFATDSRISGIAACHPYRLR
jgi:hypothetical protein